MKSRRQTFGRFARLAVSCFAFYAIHFSIEAQISRRDLPPGAVTHPNTNLPPIVVTEEAATQIDPAASASASVDVSAIVAASPAPENTVIVPAYVPGVVAGFLPSRDTNVSIGINYPSGSSDFVYLMAGRPRPGDPRVPATAPTVAAPLPALPPLAYERAEMGSRAILMRHSETLSMNEHVSRDFPAGTFLRRSTVPDASSSASSVAPGGTRSAEGRVAVGYREATHTSSGEEIIRTFPPGARLLRGAPEASQL